LILLLVGFGPLNTNLKLPTYGLNIAEAFGERWIKFVKLTLWMLSSYQCVYENRCHIEMWFLSLYPNIPKKKTLKDVFVKLILYEWFENGWKIFDNGCQLLMYNIILKFIACGDWTRFDTLYSIETTYLMPLHRRIVWWKMRRVCKISILPSKAEIHNFLCLYKTLQLNIYNSLSVFI